MKISVVYCLVFIQLAFSNLLVAQENASGNSCAYAKGRPQAKVSVADPLEDNYDMKYVKLKLSMTNDSTYLSGDVTTVATVLASSFTSYVFELDSSLIIDSVVINGVARSYSSSVHVRTVTLPVALSVGSSFTARVVYHGTPYVSATIFGGIGGINNVTSPSWGTRVTFTQSESYHAFEWWPCKQSLQDKIDSADIWITVPIP